LLKPQVSLLLRAITQRIEKRSHFRNGRGLRRVICSGA
jgi:hypothetical protein